MTNKQTTYTAQPDWQKVRLAVSILVVLAIANIVLDTLLRIF